MLKKSSLLLDVLIDTVNGPAGAFEFASRG